MRQCCDLFVCLISGVLCEVTPAVPENVILQDPDASKSRAPYRWSAGQGLGSVRELVFSDGKVNSMTTVSLEPLVLQVDKLLTDEECNALVAEAHDKQGRSNVKDGGLLERLGVQHGQYRNSSTAWVQPSAEIFHDLAARVSELTQMPRTVVEQSGPLQVVFYEKGGHYAPHHDSLKFGKGASFRRYLTLLFILEEPVAGGGTAFPLAGAGDLPWIDYFTQHPVGFSGKPCSGLVLRPPRGSALLWYNHFVDFSVDAAGLGGADVKSLHAGCQVNEGRRIVANLWLRISPIATPLEPSSLQRSEWWLARAARQLVATFFGKETDLKFIRTPRQLAESCQSNSSCSGFVVSLGGGNHLGERDARINDLDDLFDKLPLSGLVVESDGGFFSQEQWKSKWPNVDKRSLAISAITVANVLRSASVPDDLDYIGIGLGGLDCSVALAILEKGFRPKALQVKVNAEIPPPLSFGIPHSDAFMLNHGNFGFHGCSASLIVGLAAHFGYELVGVSRPCSFAFVRADLLAYSKAFETVPVNVAMRILSRLCPVNNFAALGSYEEWSAKADDPFRLLSIVRKAIQIACNISQDPTQYLSPAALQVASCNVPYTLSLAPEDFGYRSHHRKQSSNQIGHLKSTSSVWEL